MSRDLLTALGYAIPGALFLLTALGSILYSVSRKPKTATHQNNAVFLAMVCMLAALATCMAWVTR